MTTGPRSWGRGPAWLRRSLTDGALIALSVGAISILLSVWITIASAFTRELVSLLGLWHGNRLEIGWRAILWTFFSCFAISLIIEIIGANYPRRVRTAGRLRPSRNIRAYFLGLLQSLMVASVLPLIFELGLNLYLLGQKDGMPTFSPARIEWEFWLVLSLILGWTVWSRVHPRSATAARQIFSWKSLTSWTGRQKWVTFAAFAIVVTVYAANYLRNSDSQFVKHINDEIIHFKFLGFSMGAVQILTLESLGFIIGVLAVFFHGLWVPIVFRSGSSNVRDAVRRTIRQCGLDMIGSNLAGTLEFYRDILRKKQEWRSHDWTIVDEQIKETRSTSLQSP
jgi:hypothetical protein